MTEEPQQPEGETPEEELPPNEGAPGEGAPEEGAPGEPGEGTPSETAPEPDEDVQWRPATTAQPETTVKPEIRTVPSVPEQCLETAELADEVISRLNRNIRDERLFLALRDYTIASQACRREASP